MEAPAQFLAKMAHKGQTRSFGSKEPYITHVERVVELVKSLPDVTEDMIVATWLHDVVEDTDYTLENIEYIFGLTVANYVNLLTKICPRVKELKDLPRANRIVIEWERLKAAPVEVKRIKMCDRIANLEDVGCAPSSWLHKYHRESIDLLRAIGDADSSLAKRLQDKINEVKEGLETVSSG